jgi:hypothetical protein
MIISDPDSYRDGCLISDFELRVFERFIYSLEIIKHPCHAEFYFGISQDIHVCQVCDLHVANLSHAYWYVGCRNKFGMTAFFMSFEHA